MDENKRIEKKIKKDQEEKTAKEQKKKEIREKAEREKKEKLEKEKRRLIEKKKEENKSRKEQKEKERKEKEERERKEKEEKEEKEKKEKGKEHEILFLAEQENENENEKQELLKHIEDQKIIKNNSDFPNLKTENINFEFTAPQKLNNSINSPQLSQYKLKRSFSVQHKSSEKEKYAKRLLLSNKKSKESDNENNSDFFLNISEDDNNNNDCINIIDLYRNPNKYIRINSPRSLRAIYETGCNLEELYYKSFEAFIECHNELAKLSKEEQLKRYNFYNEMRINRIKDLCKYRALIIRDEKDQEYRITKENFNFISMKKEKISNGKNDGKKSVKEIILKSNGKIPNDEINNFRKKHDKELADIVEIELEKELGTLETNKQDEDYNEKNKKLNLINNGGEENSPIENDRYYKNPEFKFKHYNMKSERIDDNDDSDYYDDALKASKKKKIVLNIDERNTFKENLYALQNAKISEKYEKNQKKMEKKLERLEKMNKIKADQMAMKKRIELERTTQNLNKNALFYKTKQENLITEIQLKNLNIFQNKNRIARSIALKNELTNQKYLLTQDKIVRMRSAEENGRRLKYLQLLQKHSRYKDIKIQTNEIYDSKQYKLKYLDFMRKRNIRLIKDILQDGIDEENLQKILLAFPGNSEIYKVIQNYHNKKNKLLNGNRTNSYLKNKFMNFNNINLTNKSNAQRPKSQRKFYINLNSRGFTSSGSNVKSSTEDSKNTYIENKKLAFDRKKLKINLNSKKQKNNFISSPSNSYNFNKNVTNTNQNNGPLYSEKDIKKMVEDYRQNIYRGFFKRVEDEKMKEQVRTIQLKMTKDTKIKINLEKHFGKERAFVDRRLKMENMNIGEQVRVYEDILRKRNEINQNQKFGENLY